MKISKLNYARYALCDVKYCGLPKGEFIYVHGDPREEDHFFPLNQGENEKLKHPASSGNVWLSFWCPNVFIIIVMSFTNYEV